MRKRDPGLVNIDGQAQEMQLLQNAVGEVFCEVDGQLVPVGFSDGQWIPASEMSVAIEDVEDDAEDETELEDSEVDSTSSDGEDAGEAVEDETELEDSEVDGDEQDNAADEGGTDAPTI